MIDRYSCENMKKIWSLEQKFQYYLDVELAVCEAYYNCGKISKEDFLNIKNNAKFDVNRILELEKTLNHDVIAFLSNVNENIDKTSNFSNCSSRFVHMGLTSSDVIDSALGLQFKASSKIIEENMKKLIRILKNKALQYKNTLCIGRSHGVLAEPIVFGFKYLNWLDMFNRANRVFEMAKEEVIVGQMSGPCGTYSNIDPKIEIESCKILGLKPSKISTQVISRDRYSEYLYALTLIAKSIEFCCTEIRHLQKTEVLEVEEGFKKGQKGSSAMPHKKNPISSENLCGLARIIKNNFLTSIDNIVLWHERDISHSSCERIIFPDTLILIDYMLKRFINTIENLCIYEKNMIKNINLYGGIIFSQRVMLELVKKGLNREKAYVIVQKCALDNFNCENGDFKQSLLANEEIKAVLNSEEIENCFNVKDYLKNIDTIFNRFINV